METSHSRLVAVIVGVLAAIVATIALVTMVDLIWPQDGSRFAAGSGWMGWAALLAVMHLIGGVVGGAAVAALARSQPARNAAWVGAVVFVAFSIPALGAVDRPVEIASMLLLNLVSILGVFAGAWAVTSGRSNSTLRPGGPNHG